MPIGTGNGLMENSENACDSRFWKMRSMSKMSELTFNFSLRRLRMGKTLDALVEYGIKLLKSVDLLESALPSLSSHLGNLLPEEQRPGSWTNLLLLVSTILHERFWNDFKSAAGSEQKRYPGIVELFRWNRKHGIEAIPAKRHGRAGNHGMIAKNRRGATVRESFLPGRVESEGCPQVQPEGTRTIVDDIGIAERRHNVTGFLKRFVDSSKLVAIPDVVLISQRDDRSLTQRDTFLEIPGGSEIFCVDLDSNGKRNLPRETLKDRDRAIRRAVITHHEFVRKPLLRGDALQLSGEKAFSVERAHRDGDGEGHHFCGITKTCSRYEGPSSAFSIRGAEACSW